LAGIWAGAISRCRPRAPRPVKRRRVHSGIALLSTVGSQPSSSALPVRLLLRNMRQFVAGRPASFGTGYNVGKVGKGPRANVPGHPDMRHDPAQVARQRGVGRARAFGPASKNRLDGRGRGEGRGRGKGRGRGEDPIKIDRLEAAVQSSIDHKAPGCIAPAI